MVERQFMMHHNRPRTLVTEINANTVAPIIEDNSYLSTRTLVSLLKMSGN